MHSVRPSAVAGTFYPAIRQELESEVALLLGNADSKPAPVSPKAIIVPHAGYIYSGLTAAMAYKQLVSARDKIHRVVLLGPVHRVPVRGLALPGVEAFATPLGNVALDIEAIDAIADMPQVAVNTAAHAFEHSLEVQLPFLQTVLENFKLVPLAVGDATAAEVAEVLDKLWGGPETLIVVSSDLSHFLPYSVAQAIDQNTTQNILHMRGLITHEQACGGTPINGFLQAAASRNLHPRLLDLRNSGDTAGDKNRVVGYAAFAFMGEEHHGH